VRIWDIRGKGSGCISNIPAHSNLVSSVRYFKAAPTFSVKEDESAMDVDNVDVNRDLCSGSFLASSAYDGTCKIWTAGDFKPIKTFTGMDNKVMACDVSRDAKYIATAAYDRTLKIYGKE
jgi:U4/U6 small nuclear ribonucleoprotein PRP4